MKHFGPWPNNPQFESGVAPFNERCGRCDELIIEDEAGITTPYCGAPDDPRDEIHFHRECFLRSVFGSIAHQQRRCKCFVDGSDCNDPNMSVRQAALAAVEYREQHHRDYSNALAEHLLIAQGVSPAWIEGRISDADYDPDTHMLTYKIKLDEPVKRVFGTFDVKE